MLLTNPEDNMLENLGVLNYIWSLRELLKKILIVTVWAHRYYGKYTHLVKTIVINKALLPTTKSFQSIFHLDCCIVLQVLKIQLLA